MPSSGRRNDDKKLGTSSPRKVGIYSNPGKTELGNLLFFPPFFVEL